MRAASLSPRRALATRSIDDAQRCATARTARGRDRRRARRKDERSRIPVVRTRRRRIDDATRDDARRRREETRESEAVTRSPTIDRRAAKDARRGRRRVDARDGERDG
jgi:hypothetical protein